MNYILLIISVFLGMAIVYTLNIKTKNTNLLLSFSGAYLLSITILHLLPQVFQSSKNEHFIGIFIILGILAQSILESISKGAEHGHMHFQNNFKGFPWGLFIALNLHAFSEGIPANTNISLLWSIILHKIPVSIVLTNFFVKIKFPIKKILLFMSIFALSSPLGAYFSTTLFFENYKLPILAFSTGIFLHVSSIILLESRKDHKFSLKKFIITLLAVGLSISTLYLE